MIFPINDYRPTGFDKDTLVELKPYFDLDFVTATPSECQQWFENLYQVAKIDVGIAHCINQHQSSRNSLNVSNKLNYQYQEQLGSFSVYHDIDTIKIDNHGISGTKHWITSIHQADYLVCKVGHHSNPTRCLLFIDLKEVDHKIENNGYNPIGLKVASPMSLMLDTQDFPKEWILHQGPFCIQDSQNSLLSFLKYGFLTNFLGCAVGLYHALLQISIQKNYHLEYQLKPIESQLILLKRSWSDNFDLAKLHTLDQKYWTWHDTQYTQTKQCLTNMLKLTIEIGSSRFYDSNTQFSQRFRDALVWSSHGKPYYEQVLLSQFANIDTL
jgi:hypothetical protein